MTQRVKGIVLAIPEGKEAADLCAALLFAHSLLRIAASKYTKDGQFEDAGVHLKKAALIYDLASQML